MAPPPPRDAATVVVLRDGGDGAAEVLLLRRHRASGFAADAWVFPGGTVDDADRTLPETCWTGLDPEAAAPRFGEPPDLVLGYHVAGLRETFEEAGLLLSSTAEGEPVNHDDADLRGMRAKLADRDDPASAAEFAAWLKDRGFVLRLDALTYWSRWVTPRAEPRRYDTAFFLARLPPEHAIAHDRVEVTDQRWLTPAAALAAHRAGELHLIYPTIKNLAEMAGHRSVDDLVAHAEARPEVRRILPHIHVDADGSYTGISHPDDPDFPHALYGQERVR